MASAQFIENLGKLSISRTTKTFLGESAERLETIANKMVSNAATLTPAERAEFKNLYNDYARRSMQDWSRAGRDGAAPKTTADIRNDFFNTVLGHIGKTEAERVALRSNVIQATMESAGALKLKDGTVMPLAEVESIKKMKQMGLVVDESKLKMIQDAEQAATDFATSRATRVEARDARVASQNAKPVSKALDEDIIAKAAAIDVNIGEGVSRLQSVYKTTGKIDHENFFKALRSQLADPTQGLLKRNLNDIDPSVLSGRPREVLTADKKGNALQYGDYIEYKAPKDILNAIKDRRPITESELTRLETFFMNPAYNRTGNALSNVPAMPAYTPGTAIPAALVNTARSIIQAASSEGNVANKVPANLRTLFETGEEAGFLKRAAASITENRLVRNGVGATAIAATIGVPVLVSGVATLTGVPDPEDYGQTGTALFNIAHVNAISSAEIKDKTNSEITTYLYTRLTSGSGITNPHFVDYTKKIVGIDLEKELKDISPDDPKYRDVFYKIATTLQNRTSVPGLNGDAISAYRFAVSKHMGMPTDKLTDSISDISTFAREQVAESFANAMNAKENVTLRNNTLQSFYGKTDPSRDELVRGFASYVARPGDDPLIQLKIGHYLLQQGLIQKEDISQKGAQELNKKLIEIAAETSAAQLNADQAKGAADSTALFAQIGKAVTNSTSTPPIPAPQKALPDNAKMREILENVSIITDIPPPALETAYKAASKTGTFDKDVMVNELNKQGRSAEAVNASKWIASELAPKP